MKKKEIIEKIKRVCSPIYNTIHALAKQINIKDECQNGKLSVK